uniref:major facilitator superfamily domain-containing protein 12-like isoform X2 n=1 Tax=Osmia lignaria TaxID=473952 RepID=UPI001478B5BB|nr:major facilitator superfamily domain-containing protein 12-like isoform X2 [Osmia lignaria]
MESEQRSLAEDYSEIIQRLPISLKLSYGIGHVLNDICASMWFTYLLVFFHLVLGFDSTLSGVILLIGQIADALATPFVGLHSDKIDEFWLCKYGRRKTWHLIGTLAFVVIFQFGWAAVQISHLSLVPELTPTEHERTELIAIRYSFTVLSNIFVYCITWAVLHITNNKDANSQIGPDDADKFQDIVFIGIGTGVVTSILFHIFVKERSLSNSDGSLRTNSRAISLLLKDVQLYQVACIYMPTRIFVNLSQIYVPLYLHESLSMPATSLAIIPLIMFLSSFAISLIIEKLNTKLGRKISYSFGVILGIIACVWIKFGTGVIYTKYEIYPVSLMLGSAGSIMLVTSLGVTADFIGQNVDSGAFVYGIMSFTDKLCNGLAVMLIQYLGSWINTKNYYKDVLVYVCSSSAILGLLVLLYIKPFHNNEAYNTLSSGQTTALSENESNDILRQDHVT